jgi:hypothetical protein
MGDLMRQLKAILWFFVESFSHIQRNCHVTKQSGRRISCHSFFALQWIHRESQIPFVFRDGERVNGTGTGHGGSVGEIDATVG